MELSPAMSSVKAMLAQYLPIHMLLKLCEESKEQGGDLLPLEPTLQIAKVHRVH